MNSQGRQQADVADDLKRRARRRLVGAALLFITALLVVPALIENPPPKTESPIELVVPQRPSSVDTSPSGDSSPPTNNQVVIKPVMEGEATDPIEVAEQKPKLAGSVVTETLAAKEVPKAVDTKTVDKKPADKKTADKKVEALSDGPGSKNKAPTKPETGKAVPKAEEDPIAKFAQAEPVYWVQVAALSDKSRSDQMRAKLAELGYSARIESVQTDVGQVYRVRVGPLAGLTTATETKEKLKTSGYNGRVVK